MTMGIREGNPREKKEEIGPMEVKFSWNTSVTAEVKYCSRSEVAYGQYLMENKSPIQTPCRFGGC